MQEIIHELKKRIRGEVRFDKISRILYSTDASIYEIEPLGVVIPKSTEDIQATIEIANQHKIPIIPRGGGTSIVGNAIGEGIILDCSKYLNRVLEINREEMWARVQPGVVLDPFNQQLARQNLHFGPDVASSSRANLGGMVGNNSSGARSLVYGKTVDHVRELDVLLSDGEAVQLASNTVEEWQRRGQSQGLSGSVYTEVNRIIKEQRDEIEMRFPKILRRVAGYNLDEFVRKSHHNLAKLIVGSEGTLAVVTEAKLDLVPLPQHKVLAVVHFEDLFAALEAAGPILEHQPCAVELLDENVISVTRHTQEFSRRLTFVEGFPKALLLVEFQGNSRPELEDRLDKLDAFLKREKIGYHCVKAVEEGQQADVWTIRKAGLGLLMGSRADRKPVGFVEDSAVAPERLPEYIRRFDEIIHSHDTEAAYYAHASVGCLHIRPKLNLKNPADVEHMAQIAEEISSLALEFNGTISGEHGDGLAHSCWNEKMFGPKLYEAFREIKHVFDPKNILNPGKIVDAPPMTKNLRRPPVIETVVPFFDYSNERGFKMAVEMCNGNGLCRKSDSGTMCPSFMITGDEEDSTRGRANALRAVLSGKLAPEAFTSDRLQQVMDLCIGCKGCKGECPTNVDMAKLKSEFLYHYHKIHGLRLRDRLFGNIGALSRFGSRSTPLSNWLIGFPLVRWQLHVLLGIHRKRSLPPFSGMTFESWFKNHAGRKSDRKVVLFHDTFMNHNTPAMGIATVRVLEAAGFEVLLTQKKCCGLPFISKGMLEQASENARFNVECLARFSEQGIPIVGCEPSCILTFRDEYPDLIPCREAKLLAANSFLIEEFFAKEKIELSLAPAQSKFLLHGHCHQKALVGVEPTVNLLKQIPDAEVEVIDSGCCGMAGSFGFEKEHYDFSMAIGRRKLFPAIEGRSDWEIIAPGVSCRQQIAHGTGRQARHPIELLAAHLNE